MKHFSNLSSRSLRKQRGFVFKLIHSLLLVVGVVSLVLLYKAGKLPFINYRPNLSTWNLGANNNRTEVLWETADAPPPNQYFQAQQRKSVRVTREREDTRYTNPRYAVQVAAGYDSRQLYKWRNELARDGHDAYLVSLNTSRGLLLKLRVGAFTSRAEAEALRTKIRSRYPNNFGTSFIVEGD